jgi:hypothetical protein
MGIPATRVVYDRPEIVPPPNMARYVLVIKLLAFASIISSPVWLAALFFTSPEDYSPNSSLVCVPLLAIFGAVAVIHFTQNEPYLRRLMLTGLLAHMLASSVFLWVGFNVYSGTVDAFHYWTMGLQIAERFQIVGWNAFHGPYSSTNLISNICGITTLLIGDGLPTLFVASSFVALAGAYLFYRTFTIAFPEGDRWLFGLLVVLLPSLLFWSSFVGKDSLIQYFIALTCYGFARITQRPSVSGVVFCAMGLAGALLVRAHVAAMLAVAITFPYAVGRSRPGSASKAAKLILIPFLAVSTYFLVSQAKNFIDLQNENSTSVLQQADIITRNSQIGGSAFNEGASLPLRIAASPFLLFRPFPWEMHTAMAIPAALESLGLIYLLWVRRREIGSTLRHWRDPFISFLLMYSAIFLVTFGGSISNFGILLRQRIMVVPAVLMLLCARQEHPVPLASQRMKAGRWLSSAIRLSPRGRIPAEP